MATDSSNFALKSLIEHICIFQNYDQLRAYGITVRPDILIQGKLIVKYQGNEFNYGNDPPALKSCLERILKL
ncbi:hypothetical protein AHMF7605_21795 [Adhaeribacter arboris]|uniref:Thioredoxin-like fold domain-containing protein n=1 Tax=Adhaeribacter arboris TaxID=2072846 RepID=A0A2T2YKF0_9BACT|nr:hypothetical protein AHMF7605_21795 [Adhaeribacter arboris]